MKIIFSITLFVSFVVFTAIMTAGLLTVSSKQNIATNPTIVPTRVAATSTPKKNNTTTIPTTVPTPAITMAEVAKHNSVSSCWFTVDNKVYDATSFIDQHSGGSNPILQSCGQDASSYFHSRHGNRELSYMSSFLIGTISQ